MCTYWNRPVCVSSRPCCGWLAPCVRGLLESSLIAVGTRESPWQLSVSLQQDELLRLRISSPSALCGWCFGGGQLPSEVFSLFLVKDHKFGDLILNRSTTSSSLDCADTPLNVALQRERLCHRPMERRQNPG